jgi:hypothetical protein
VSDPNLEKLALVAARLEPLGTRVVFVGGATIGLYVDAVTAGQLRATLDVDCVVPVDNRLDYALLESRLRRLGFVNRMEEGDPICRWTVDDVVVDVMPLDARVLGFTNRFYRLGYENAARPRLRHED